MVTEKKNEEKNPNAMIQATPYNSFLLGQLPKGCSYCVTGEKSVMYVTGLCPMNCFYCPLSEEKKQKDVIYINEIPINQVLHGKDVDRNKEAVLKEIIKEVTLCGSKGVGITGGDPLVKGERTAFYIKALKDHFGKSFHIHLYTPFALVTKERLQMLFEAGLDEIRFHPMLDRKEEWKKIALAKSFSWDIGIEIPILPDQFEATKQMLSYFYDQVDFINLNELEISHTNEEAMMQHGYHIKPHDPSAAEHSLETGKQLLAYFAQRRARNPDGHHPNIHLCTAALKDGHQLKNRLLRRAQHLAQAYDEVTDEGLLKRGIIYLKTLYPSLTYKQKLQEILATPQRKAFYEQKLQAIKKQLEDHYSSSSADYILSIGYDPERLRLLVPLSFIAYLEEIRKGNQKDEMLSLLLKEIKYGWVEEYPTFDKFEIELEILN